MSCCLKAKRVPSSSLLNKAGILTRKYVLGSLPPLPSFPLGQLHLHSLVTDVVTRVDD